MNSLRFSILSSLFALGCSGSGTTKDDTSSDFGDGCPDNEVLFEDTVWEPVLSQQCLVCHGEGGVAEESRFQLKREGEGADWLRQNMDIVEKLAWEEEDGVPVLLLKPTNLHSEGHGGAEVITANSESYNALSFYASWVRGELESCDESAGDACEDDVLGPRLLRRLTHTAYDNTVYDLLGVSSDFGAGFASDNVVDGFFNNAEALTVSGLLADQYRDAAENIAAQAVTFHLDTLLSCDPVEDGQAYCAAVFIRDLGGRAFRRPLTEDELSSYWTVWDAVAVEDGFSVGLQWTLTALLQSPHFLYRMELGTLTTEEDSFALSDWEVASQLSYLFWDTMPDAALFARASSGELHTDLDIQEEVERMLADPRSNRVMDGFVEQWLHLDRLIKVPKIMQVYPELTFSVRGEMLRETQKLASTLMADEGSLSDLLQAEHSYMTDDLAAYYGLPAGEGEADSEGFRRVELQGTPYGGLLAQGSLLTTFARPDSSSPVHRGVLIRERVLCQELPPPPPNLEVKPPEMDPDKTTREQYAQHSSDPACADCHERIDPIGFGFEHFDGSGVYREMDGIHEIDDSGEVVKAGGASGAFDGVQDLSQLLSGTEEVEGCYVKMWMTYATGLHEQEVTQCATGLIQKNADASGIALAHPIQGLTTLRHFTQREGNIDESNGPADGVEITDLGTYSAMDDSKYPELDTEGGGTGSDGVTLELVEVSRWGAGYCADGFVTNNSDSEVIWEVSDTLEGTISSIWNANKREAGSLTYFTGVSWNGSLAPGASTSFGFCADI